jgi:hypothetical protein
MDKDWTSLKDTDREFKLFSESLEKLRQEIKEQSASLAVTYDAFIYGDAAEKRAARAPGVIDAYMQRLATLRDAYKSESARMILHFQLKTGHNTIEGPLAIPELRLRVMNELSVPKVEKVEKEILKAWGKEGKLGNS